MHAMKYKRIRKYAYTHIRICAYIHTCIRAYVHNAMRSFQISERGTRTDMLHVAYMIVRVRTGDTCILHTMFIALIKS